MKDARPIIARLREAAELNVAPRVRENLCMEASALIGDMATVLASAVADHGPFGDDTRPRWWQDACTVLAKAKPGPGNGSR